MATIPMGLLALVRDISADQHAIGIRDTSARDITAYRNRICLLVNWKLGQLDHHPHLCFDHESHGWQSLNIRAYSLSQAIRVILFKPYGKPLDWSFVVRWL